MNINKVWNSTLAKLTAEEIGNLGLCNYGVGLYRGELKSRKKGFKTVRVSDDCTHFENPAWRIEFIKIVSTGDVQEYAARIFNKAKGEYETYPMGIVGCDFFK